MNNMRVSNHFGDAAERFESWARDELFQEEHRSGSEILEKSVDIHLELLFLELKLTEQLVQPTTARILGEMLGFTETGWIALDAMLMRLSIRHDFLTMTMQDDEPHYQALHAPKNRSEELEELRTRMSELGKNYEAPMEFLEFGVTHFTRSLRDDHTFMDRVLTGQESEFAETWHRATNTDPLQDVHGIMGAKALELLFENGSILEVGGGTGNGIRNNLHQLKLADKLPLLSKYVFTDVSMQLILGTRNEFKEKYPDTDCEWRLLDINKDFIEQRVEPNFASIVYGVNSAHIAKHTVDFLIECKRALKPGGIVVFSERIRRFEHDMAPREIVLNQSKYHRTAAQRDPEYRPTHAYLTREHWLRALELAGYKEFEVWPSTASLASYFPDQYAVVVVAKV